MLNSKDIRKILKVGTRRSQAVRPRKQKKHGEEAISSLKEKIKDNDYMNVALKKIATDLAREFF